MLGLGAMLLVFAWMISPIPSPALYDGLILPGQNYRYLPPQNGGKPPSSATKTVSIAHGKTPQLFLETKETPPQAILIVNANSLGLPAGAKHLTVSIKPVLPPVHMKHGFFDGNVYQFRASANGQTLPLSKPGSAEIQLRRPGATGSPYIAQYRHGRWVKRPSAVFFNANYLAANVSSLGYFTLALTHGPTSGGISPLIIVGIAAIVVVIAGLAALRFLRTR